MKGVKEQYRDSGVYELCRFCVFLGIKYLKIIFVFFLYRLLKEMKLLKRKYLFLERRKLLFIYENSREKQDRDRGKINVDFRKQVTGVEVDIFKNSFRSFSSRSSLFRYQLGESLLGVKFQLLLVFYCRERELKKLRRE